MTLDPVQFAWVVTWAVTALGVGLWLWSWFGEKHPIQRLRFSDCGMVLVFSSVLARIVIQEKAMSVFDWAMAILGPLFILAALWRLSRTGVPPAAGGQ